MEQNYLNLFRETSDKIDNDERTLFILPVAGLQRKLDTLKQMTYSQFSQNNKEENAKYLEKVLDEQIKNGKTPENAKKIALAALRDKLSREKQTLINKIEEEKTEIGNRYYDVLKVDLDTMRDIMGKWDIAEEVRASTSEDDAYELSKAYVRTYNLINDDHLQVSDIIKYYNN